MQVAIIGSGIAGLASAIRLAYLGHSVEVYEAQATYGGKLAQITLGGYRFDAGPSLCTLPKLIDELFEFCNRNPRDYISYDRLSLSHRVFFDDGIELDIPTDLADLASHCSQVFGVSEKRILRYLDLIKRQFTLTAPHFLDSDSLSFRSFFSLRFLYGVLKQGIIKPFLTMHELNTRYLIHPKLVQIFDRFATYNGSSPYLVPGILTLIAYTELGHGVYLPKGGIRSIAEALYTLACELGVKFNFNQKVNTIITGQANTKPNTKSSTKSNSHRQKSKARVQALMTDTKKINADIVVSNMDVNLTYTKLLKDKYPSLPRKVKKQIRRWKTQPSSSALVFYWGINRTFPQLDVHNIFFSRDYKAEFETIFDKNHNVTIYKDPTVYVNISSKVNDSDAPNGCENWFVMLNVASDWGQDWDAIVLIARAAIIAKLNPLLRVDLDEHIVQESVLTPRDIAEHSLSSGGALYGSNSNTISNALMRHSNTSSYIDGLYFCGGSVHPGGGIPLCLASAKRVAYAVSRKTEATERK